jgi:hypothetical protein
MTSDPKTCEIEQFAKLIGEGGFDPDNTVQLIKKVCGWGGYSGVSGRVLRDNTVSELCALMARALSRVKEGDVCGGLSSLLEIKGLGVSFASKHLKFIAPDRAVVLDSVISSRLGYPLSLIG